MTEMTMLDFLMPIWNDPDLLKQTLLQITFIGGDRGDLGIFILNKINPVTSDPRQARDEDYFDLSKFFGGSNLAGASLFKIFQAYDFVAGRLALGLNM